MHPNPKSAEISAFQKFSCEKENFHVKKKIFILWGFHHSNVTL